MTQALVIVDIQNDYFAGGKMELVGSSEAAGEAARLLRAFRERGAPVFHIQHVSTRPGATFFLPDTEGVKIHESVAPLAGLRLRLEEAEAGTEDPAVREEIAAAMAELDRLSAIITELLVLSQSGEPDAPAGGRLAPL